MRYSELQNPVNELVYTASYYLWKPVAEIALGLKVMGRENIPDQGAAIIAPNHRHWLDAPMLPYAVKERHLTMVARDDLATGRFGRWYWEQGEVIRISRHGFTKENFREIDDRLKAGRLISIFPEETRGDKAMRKADRRANLGPFKSGVAKFAQRHDIPTIPTALSGFDHAFTMQHQRIGRIVFGEPMEAPGAGQSSKQSFLEELRVRIETLYDQGLEA